MFGFENPVIMQWLKEMVPAKIVFIGTTPPSVPGIRTQRLLKKAFEAAGGTFLMGDEALDAVLMVNVSQASAPPISASCA